ncbi:MAG TPA: LysE family transporter [Thermomicrobiales bacterium]|nr:LysE family transporter [Thermomicrobiales bacterium]
MDASLFPRGLAIGFAIAAPVGAIGVLCIRRTLADGHLIGFVSGLGAATADATYGAVAAFGLSGVAALLTGAQNWIRLGGGLFLIGLGVRTALAPPLAKPAVAAGAGLAGAYASTLALTLTNPSTIFSFAAVFAGIGLAEASGDPGAAALLTAGVFFGSAVWWLILSSAVSLCRAALTPSRLVWVNRLSGAVLAMFGAAALLSVGV